MKVRLALRRPTDTTAAADLEDPQASEPLPRLLDAYLTWASSGRYAESTVRARRCYVAHFVR